MKILNRQIANKIAKQIKDITEMKPIALLIEEEEANQIANLIKQYQKTYNIPDEDIVYILWDAYKCLGVDEIIVSNLKVADVYEYSDLMTLEEYYLHFYFEGENNP